MNLQLIIWEPILLTYPQVDKSTSFPVEDLIKLQPVTVITQVNLSNLRHKLSLQLSIHYYLINWNAKLKTLLW